MGPAATSLALLCLCSLSLGGPTGTANASPTQVRRTQWAPLWLRNTGTLLLATHFCFQMLLLRYSECMCMCSACVRDANGKEKLEQKQYLMTMIFFLLFAQAKKTCPKLQKLCLNLILRKADYSFLFSFFSPHSVNGTEMLMKKF